MSLNNSIGTIHTTELRTIPFLHNGEPHVLQIARDITERKRADEALRASEEQYRAIFNASPNALILWDSQFRRVDVNPAYERLYGWKREDVIGRGFEIYSAADSHVQPRRDLVRRALAGETCHAEFEGVDAPGDPSSPRSTPCRFATVASRTCWRSRATSPSARQRRRDCI